ELSGARLLRRGDERAATTHPVVAVALAVDAQQLGALAEQLVLDAEELAAAGGEVPAADEPHRRPPGGPVERLGDRRPPVDDERLLRLVGHGDAPDVVALAPLGAGLVDPPEDEAGVADVEVLQPLGDVL